MAKVKGVGPERLDRAARPVNGKDDLGELADSLRATFCGSKGLMRTEEALRTWQRFFAAVAPGARDDSENQFVSWLQRVARNEFADELIVAAAALQLRLRIVCIPYTPAGSQQPWAVTEYPSADAQARLGIAHERLVVLGNNNVRYVWLAPVSP